MDWFRFAADPLAVSVPERNKNRVWVYDGVLYMQGENVGNYNIYDVFGKLVASGYAEKGEVYVNDLPSGIYIIKNEKNVVGKFLK